MKDKHDHDFDKLIIKRIRADNVNYNGTTGDKAFILRICSCGLEVAVDMGVTKLMATRYKELTNVSRTEVATDQQ